MKLYLRGIYENGLPADPQLPADPRTAVRMSRSGTLVITFQIFNRSGSTYKLEDGDTVTLTIRKRTTDKTRLFKQQVAFVDATDANNGIVTFTVAPSDTSNPLFLPGIYAFDIWLSHAGNLDPVMPISPWLLGPSVAFPEA